MDWAAFYASDSSKVIVTYIFTQLTVGSALAIYQIEAWVVKAMSLLER
jgi:hypothetical protein